MNRLVIASSRLFDGVSETPLDNAVLTIEDGVVAEVGTYADAPPAGAVHLPDATILPGLVDCHVHLPFDASADPVASTMAKTVPAATLQAVRNAQTLLRHGVTTVRDVSSPHGIAIELRDAIAQGLLDGPDIRACGTHLTITGGHGCAFGIEVDSVDEIRTAVRTQIKAGADLLKVMATGGVYSLRQTPEDVQFSVTELRAAVDTAHERGLTVAAHSEGEDGIRTALEAGVDTVEHGNQLTPELAKRMIEQGAYLVPTVGAFTTVAASPDLPAPFLRKARQLVKQTERALAIAREHGVKVAIGSDSGTAPHLAWEDHPTAREAAYLVDMGGYAPVDALRSATLHGAQALRVADRKGSLEPGKDADVLVVAGDATADIAALTRPLVVVKRGRIVHRAA
ncbi:amidohydrolase family protein [Nonomuraea terrae]|uniref:Amidohydrolase family protein n=1 Tax=Nonomuraea terrae TaxID=2530383 RepID=A0A4R4Z1L8_9ACTN|nr:amidohydrolase family protein [Nonomuraea terrae]TDD51818.1 amidohydrolase family protein [Nonomuraea terrae]